ncbi:MAG: biopolymer transporter ExbD [Elusimicrobiota bacterium]
MIPLIDVSLVLLIIFMVMTPFLVQHQIRVNLPHSVSTSESPDRPIVVMVQREGEMSINGRAVSAATLESALQSELSTHRDRPVMIQADRDVVLQKIVSIMDVAKRLSVAKLGISVEQKK